MVGYEKIRCRHTHTKESHSRVTMVKVVQSMYTNARSRVRVNDSLSEEFSVKVGVPSGFST